MEKYLRTYRLTEIPDPAFAGHKVADNPVSAIFEKNAQFLRMLAEFPAGSVTVKMRYFYDPDRSRQRQNRLKVFLLAQSNVREQDDSLSLLLEKGPLNQFYSLKKCKSSIAIAWDKFNACCDITRKQNIFVPTVSQEFNSMAMPCYYSIEPFKANNSNDYMHLDNLLDRLITPVVIDICVGPSNTSSVGMKLSKCISRYQSINRTWDHDDSDYFKCDCRDDGQDWSAALKPLRQKEIIVDEALRTIRKLNDSLTEKHLKFSIRIFAKNSSIAQLLGSVIAESGLRDGIYQIYNSSRGNQFFDSLIQNKNGMEMTTPPVFESTKNINEIELYKDLSVLCNMATIDEIVGVFRFPVASTLLSPQCIRKDTDPINESVNNSIVVGSDTNGVQRGIKLNNLVKHCCVFGQSGSGKSIFCTSLISQLCMKNIPFVLFEPGKSEYRRLKRLKNSKKKVAKILAKKLRLFTPGNDISPLNLNPLQIPQEVPVYTHIENLLSCFKAAMPMEGPMLGILAEALEMVYEDHEDLDYPPIIGDVHAAVKKVLAGKSYGGEVKSNFEAAFDVRLGQLSRRGMGQVFKSRYSSPILEELLTSFSIIELAALPPELSCLLTLFILTLICEHVRSRPWSGEGVRLAIILEEAHNLVGTNTDATVSDTNSDPKAFAAELICRMLAELRSLGIAIIILDQMPSAVAAQVVKNTCTKIVFRQVDNSDRQIIGGAMLFNDVDMEQIARLRPGHAYFHTEGYYRPKILTTVNLQDEWGIPQPPVGTEILTYIKDDSWFVETVSSRIIIQAQHLKEGLDKYNDYRQSLITQIKGIQAEFLDLSQNTSDIPKNMAELLGKSTILCDKFNCSLVNFRKLYYTPYILSEKHAGLADKPASDYLNKQRLRHEKMCQFNQKYITILENIINHLKKHIQ